MAGISTRTKLSGNIGNTDLFLISKDNGNGTFTSYKADAVKIKSLTQPTLTTNAFLGSTNTSGGVAEEIPMVDAYITTGTAYTLLTNVANWTAGVYTGTAITGTYQGQSTYNGSYWFTAVDDNNWIRLVRG